jgi:hypothetical protein
MEIHEYDGHYAENISTGKREKIKFYILECNPGEKVIEYMKGYNKEKLLIDYIQILEEENKTLKNIPVEQGFLESEELKNKINKKLKELKTKNGVLV